MERAIGTTFKVGNDELIVKEVEADVCIDKNGEKCYFHKICTQNLKVHKEAGDCISVFRKDRKCVIFTEK